MPFNIFNKYLTESCFPDYWKVSSMVHAFINAGETFVAKTYFSVCNPFFFLDGNIFGKLVNNRLVGCLEKYRSFLISIVDSSLLVLIQIFNKCSRHNCQGFYHVWCNSSLTLSWSRPWSYRNQSIDMRSKSMDWFLYDNSLRHERVKHFIYRGVLTGFGILLFFKWLSPIQNL